MIFSLKIQELKEIFLGFDHPREIEKIIKFFLYFLFQSFGF